MPSAGQLVFRSTTNQIVKVSLVGGEKVLFTALPRSSWAFHVEAAGAWSAESLQVMGEAGSTTAATLAIWPTSTLTGTYVLPKGSIDGPKSLSIRLARPPSSPGVEFPEGSVACQLDANRGWSCEVPAPAVPIDIAIHAAGFVPVYVWGLAVSGGARKTIGPIALRPGASVAGWLATEDGTPLAARTEALLLPQLGPGASEHDLRERLQRPAATALARKDGFFQLVDVPPGTYLLEARSPGFAPARVSSVAVVVGSESWLQVPLVLRRPLDLTFTLDPPRDWLDRPWHVTVARASDLGGGYSGRPLFDSDAPAGEVKLPGSAPGLYAVTAADAAGNRMLYSQDIAIEGPADASQALTITLVRVKGKVLLGDKPLAATLWFGGRSGAKRARMESGEDGTFVGMLPDKGRWTVEVSAEESAINARVSVTVDPPPGKPASVEVKVDDTELFGRVEDESGAPVPGADVDLSSPLGTTSSTTNRDGHFEFRGTPAGMVQVSAEIASRGDTESSDEQLVDLHEGEPRGPVLLVLRRERSVTGHVVSPRGPVAGAVVRVMVVDPLGGLVKPSRTNLDGGFRTTVPANARMLSALVSAPGYGLRAAQFSVDQSKDTLLSVGEEAGELEIATPRLPSGGDDAILVIWQDGVALPLGALAQWAIGHGATFQSSDGFHLPALAPGRYRACLGTPRVVDASQLQAWAEHEARCADGYLAAGGVLRLSVGRPGG